MRGEDCGWTGGFADGVALVALGAAAAAEPDAGDECGDEEAGDDAADDGAHDGAGRKTAAIRIGVARFCPVDGVDDCG